MLQTFLFKKYRVMKYVCAEKVKLSLFQIPVGTQTCHTNLHIPNTDKQHVFSEDQNN